MKENKKETWKKIKKENISIKSQIWKTITAVISIFISLFTSIFEYGLARALKLCKKKTKFAVIAFLLIAGAILALAGNVIVKDGVLDVTDFNVGSGVFFVNGTSGNVGIGTTNPSERLEVIGNINASGIICDSIGCIGTGADTDWAESGGNVYRQTGNVGIGTTNPTSKLHVTGGEINASGGLIIETRALDPSSPKLGQMWLITP